MKILVVDDHPHVRDVVTRLVGSLGHETVGVPDGEAAEDALRAHEDIAVVLLDMVLENTDGVAVARRLEEVRPGIRFLFMSGYGTDALLVPELAGARRGFLGKPFSLAALRKALTGLLATA